MRQRLCKTGIGFICLLIAGQVSAQQGDTLIIKGTVSTAQGLAKAADIVLLKEDSTKVATITSNNEGSFAFIQLTPGSYILKISSLGYAPAYRNIRTATRTTDAGNIRLEPFALDAVIVTAGRPLFAINNEKKIFDVGQSLASKGGSATDVLRQVPAITVNGAGKITLRGAVPVIWVDGKPTQLRLDQIPADQIKSVEIITNPSARYDASGSSGIINIILKKNSTPGWSGSIDGNYTSLPEYTLHAEAGRKKGKTNLSMSYLQHGHKNKGEGTLTRTAADASNALDQQGADETKGLFQRGGAALDYEADSANTFTFSTDIGGGRFTTHNNQTTDYFSNEQTDSAQERKTVDTETFLFYHGGIDYVHLFRQKGEKLTFSGSLETYHGTDEGHYESRALKEDIYTSQPFLQQYANTIRAHTWLFQSDYVKPLKKETRLGSGVKATLHSDHNETAQYDLDSTSGEDVLNTQASYQYHYRDNTYAVYGTYSGKMNRFSYTGGLRYELYDFKGSMLDNMQPVAYQDRGLFPSLSLTQQRSNTAAFHLNYSRRVNRPEYDQISPRIDYTNPLLLTTGNTHLRPEYIHAVEFSYEKKINKTNLFATLYYRHTQGLIATYITPFSGDTLLSRYVNAGSSDHYGMELIGRAVLLTGWEITCNVNALQEVLHTNGLPGSGSSDGFTWFAKLSSDIRLQGAWLLQFSGNYHATEIVPQGKDLPTGSADISVNKEFLKRKQVSATLSLSDVFNTEKDRSILMLSDNVTQRVNYKPYSRILKLTFLYRLGK